MVYGDGFIYIQLTCWLFPSLRSRDIIPSSSLNLLRVVLMSLWRSLYSWYWSLKTALYFSLSSTQLISGYFLWEWILGKTEKWQDIYELILLLVSVEVPDEGRKSQHLYLKRLLTWCSLPWCALWGCIQALWFCSDWLDSYGPQRRVHADWCDLYSEIYPFHPWMICVLFFGGPAESSDETLLEANGKN